jgi:acyl phosphate:glycerol-3-phosphate acyltransferase
MSCGYAVFFADMLKGFFAVRLATILDQHFDATHEYFDFFAILAATVCVLGHTFPIWLKFKGGKGVATSAGVMLGLAPVPTLIALFVWILVFEITRYVSVASVAAAIALPAAIGVLLRLRQTSSAPILYSAIVIAIVVCWRHRTNFTRLLQGTEQRFPRR